jgi:hypothetical protein
VPDCWETLVPWDEAPFSILWIALLDAWIRFGASSDVWVVAEPDGLIDEAGRSSGLDADTSNEAKRETLVVAADALDSTTPLVGRVGLMKSWEEALANEDADSVPVISWEANLFPWDSELRGDDTMLDTVKDDTVAEAAPEFTEELSPLCDCWETGVTAVLWDIGASALEARVWFEFVAILAGVSTLDERLDGALGTDMETVWVSVPRVSSDLLCTGLNSDFLGSELFWLCGLELAWEERAGLGDVDIICSVVPVTWVVNTVGLTVKLSLMFEVTIVVITVRETVTAGRPDMEMAELAIDVDWTSEDWDGEKDVMRTLSSDVELTRDDVGWPSPGVKDVGGRISIGDEELKPEEDCLIDMLFTVTVMLDSVAIELCVSAVGETWLSWLVIFCDGISLKDTSPCVPKVPGCGMINGGAEEDRLWLLYLTSDMLSGVPGEGSVIYGAVWAPEVGVSESRAPWLDPMTWESDLVSEPAWLGVCCGSDAVPWILEDWTAIVPIADDRTFWVLSMVCARLLIISELKMDSIENDLEADSAPWGLCDS